MLPEGVSGEQMTLLLSQAATESLKSLVEPVGRAPSAYALIHAIQAGIPADGTTLPASRIRIDGHPLRSAIIEVIQRNELDHGRPRLVLRQD
jgi:hypothetical protein